MTVLHSSTDFDAAFEKSNDRPIVIFKHSATCPYSARAQEQVAEAKHEVEAYCMVVQYDKELSKQIAERTGVEHKSPQAIVLDKGNAIWSGWRDEIQRSKLVELAGQAKAATS